MQWRLCLGLLLGLMNFAPTGPAMAAAEDSVLSQWVEMTRTGAEIRAVVRGSACPSALIDGKPVALHRRSPADAVFPGVCATALSETAQSAELNGARLPIPSAAPRRIVLFADSGCRISKTTLQTCNDPKAWPFADVVRRAAARRPDLVIHGGDYYYRETPCPPGVHGCEGSPYGDRWETWRTEFFTPAQPLLEAAPWVFVRGNHEICGRGAMGWFRLLDAADQVKTCPSGVDDAMTIDIGGLNLYVLDSSYADDRAPSVHELDEMGRQLDQISGLLAKTPGWILTHRPVWGRAPVLRLGPFGPVEVSLNAPEQASLRHRDIDGVQMVLSGHIHNFEAFDFGPARPAQLIVGTGGDIGEPADTPRIQAEQVSIDGASAEWLSFDRFGYFVFDRVDEPARREGSIWASDWIGVFYDANDRPVVRCRLSGRSLRCAPAG